MHKNITKPPQHRAPYIFHLFFERMKRQMPLIACVASLLMVFTINPVYGGHEKLLLEGPWYDGDAIDVGDYRCAQITNSDGDTGVTSTESQSHPALAACVHSWGTMHQFTEPHSECNDEWPTDDDEGWYCYHMDNEGRSYSDGPYVYVQAQGHALHDCFGHEGCTTERDVTHLASTESNIPCHAHHAWAQGYWDSERTLEIGKKVLQENESCY